MLDNIEDGSMLVISGIMPVFSFTIESCFIIKTDKFYEIQDNNTDFMIQIDTALVPKVEYFEDTTTLVYPNLKISY